MAEDDDIEGVVDRILAEAAEDQLAQYTQSTSASSTVNTTTQATATVPTQTELVPCPYGCGGSFKKRGVARHQAYCHLKLK